VVPVFQGEHKSCSFNSSYLGYDYKHDYLFIASHDCIMVFNCTHVTESVPKAQASTFHGRKHYTGQNVLLIVDFDLRFTYMLASWEGSAHDASILVDSLSRHDGLQIPYGKLYPGNAGYACRPRILPTSGKQGTNSTISLQGPDCIMRKSCSI
jgi:hypothetical protein